MKAYIAEIMETIQGEGLTAGARQIFVRFCGCNLRCSYCDTKASLVKPETGIFYPRTGKTEDQELFLNPLDISTAIELVQEFSSSWISFTGGEPLLWTEFITEFALKLKPTGYKFLLETNGTLIEELKKCLSMIDMISMDFKLPSATGEDNWENHYFFLKEAAAKSCYVKVVVNKDTKEEELGRVFDIVKKVDYKIPVFLQPATIENKPDLTLLPFLLKMQKKGLSCLDDIRIMPQMHVYLKLT